MSQLTSFGLMPFDLKVPPKGVAREMALKTAAKRERYCPTIILLTFKLFFWAILGVEYRVNGLRLIKLDATTSVLTTRLFKVTPCFLMTSLQLKD